MKFLLDTTPGKKMDLGFTIIICFSRAWCVDPFMKRFREMEIEKDKCHLIVFDNSEGDEVCKKLLQTIKNISIDFYSVRYVKENY